MSRTALASVPETNACPTCGRLLLWQTLAGMRLYTERDGVKFYPVKCTGSCGIFDVTLSAGRFPKRVEAPNAD